MPAKKTATTTPKASSNIWPQRLAHLESRLSDMVSTIREFVEIESPSDNKLAADRMGALLAGRFQALAGQARVHRAEEYGDSIQINFAARNAVKPVLLLGHFDTVYPVGTLASMPCRVEGGRM